MAASIDNLFALDRAVLDPELGVLRHSLRLALENELAPPREVEILALVLLGLVPVLALVAAEEFLLVLRPLREPLVVAIQVEALALEPQLLIILQGDEFQRFPVEPGVELLVLDLGDGLEQLDVDRHPRVLASGRGLAADVA